MKMDNKMVFVFLLFMVVIVHNAWSQSTANVADEENHVEPTDRLTIVLGDDDGGGGDQHAAESADDPHQHQQEHQHQLEQEQQEHHEPAATTETVTGTASALKKKADRSGRQLYQPFAYQPAAAFPQRRAYRGPKKRPRRNKPGGRRPRPHRRRPSGPSGPQQPSSAGRYRRLPGPVRQQQVNYIDAPPADYYYDDVDVYESVGGGGGGGGGGGQQLQSVAAPYVDYVEQREFDRDPVAGAYAAVVPTPLHAVTGRSRKRPAVMGGVGFADEQVVHVPVLRVIRPTVVAAAAAAVPSTAAPTTTTADPMEKLRQLVHEAMDAHFANRHQDLYSADGTFDNKQQRHHVYSAKYKRHPAKEAQADAVKSAAKNNNNNNNNNNSNNYNNNNNNSNGNKDLVLQYVSYATPPPQPPIAQDADADGSDDRLTLAEISAYMGAKPAETVLSAGGHRYVLSDALQQTYRHQQQQQQQHHHQQQEQQLQLQYGGDGHHQYLRYVSPFEAMYELPAARWAYK